MTYEPPTRILRWLARSASDEPVIALEDASLRVDRNEPTTAPFSATQCRPEASSATAALAAFTKSASQDATSSSRAGPPSEVATSMRAVRRSLSRPRPERSLDEVLMR